MPKVAVIYYSATGNVHALAEAVADGAASEGGEVRLRRVAELASEDVIESNPTWLRHVEATESVEVATIDDIRWAHAIAFGSPTRFGNVSAQLKQSRRGSRARATGISRPRAIRDGASRESRRRSPGGGSIGEGIAA